MSPQRSPLTEVTDAARRATSRGVGRRAPTNQERAAVQAHVRRTGESVPDLAALIAGLDQGSNTAVAAQADTWEAAATTAGLVSPFWR